MENSSIGQRFAATKHWAENHTFLVAFGLVASCALAAVFTPASGSSAPSSHISTISCSSLPSTPCDQLALNK